MPLPEDFASESLYAPTHWFVDDIVEMGPELLVARTDTTKLGDYVEAQQPWPAQPKHVPATVMLQITGTLGNLHAVYELGLKMSEGWVGFGGTIHEAKFKGLGEIGPAMDVRMEVERVRKLKGQVFGTYRFRYEQEGRLIYTGRQTAAWLRAPKAAE